jgi:hypothetical protein
MSDPEFGVDIEGMARVFDEASVIVVRFHVIAQRLLLDMRGAPGDAPLIRLLRPVDNAEERDRYLQQQRPSMSLPDQIIVVGWPRYVQAMLDTGLWERITQRLLREGGPEMQGHCDEAYLAVRAAERAELAAAIRGGEGYQSLWERATSR